MGYCCVPYCASRSGKTKEVSFHSFPKDSKLKNEWLRNISRQGDKVGKKWIPSEHARVCSRHFETTCFSISTKIKTLLPKSLPTIFEDYPAYMRKDIPKPRRKLPKIRLPLNNATITAMESVSNEISTPPPSQDFENIVQSAFNRKKNKRISKLRTYIKKLRRRIIDLKKQNKCLQSGNAIRQSTLKKQLNKIVNGADSGDLSAGFLLEQILSFGSKNHHYEETTLKVCALLQKRSPKGYRFLRNLKLLHIPHRTTLKRFIGYPSGERGITSLIKARLVAQLNKLINKHEKVGSLIIDEMSIRAKLLYDRRIDTFLGTADNSSDVNELGIKDHLANRLLCFIFRGLSTSDRIPVAFFFTNSLKGSELYELTLQTLKSVEECGFIIQRIVADNSKVNCALFSQLSGGTIKPEIPHPTDSTRKLFLAFDQSHIIKNVRNQLLKKRFSVNGQTVSIHHLRRLYRYQRVSGSPFKPVRFLTRKVLYPNNLEKMNVARALQIFSVPVTSALETMAEIAPEKIDDLQGLKETVHFMKTFRKWHEIHDVCNKTQGWQSRNPNKNAFFCSSDDRLSWLLNDFIRYIEAIQTNATDENSAFSKETFEALLVTTKSTALCISYLLESGFHYVLSRHFSSDDIESFFSHLRQMGGNNDAMDARSCLFAIESSLKTGIISSSMFSNVGLTSSLSTGERISIHTQGRNAEPSSTDSGGVPQDVQAMLNEILHPSAVKADMDSTTLAMVGGYLVRVAEEVLKCEKCLAKICAPRTHSPLMRLIYNQDRGGLSYPTVDFVHVLQTISKFVVMSLRHINLTEQGVRKKLRDIIFPFLQKKYSCDCQSIDIFKMLLEKFLNPLLDNCAKNATENGEYVRNYQCKPVSRKPLRM